MRDADLPGVLQAHMGDLTWATVRALVDDVIVVRPCVLLMSACGAQEAAQALMQAGCRCLKRRLWLPCAYASSA